MCLICTIQIAPAVQIVKRKVVKATENLLKRKNLKLRLNSTQIQNRVQISQRYKSGKHARPHLHRKTKLNSYYQAAVPVQGCKKETIRRTLSRTRRRQSFKPSGLKSPQSSFVSLIMTVCLQVINDVRSEHTARTFATSHFWGAALTW